MIQFAWKRPSCGLPWIQKILRLAAMVLFVASASWAQLPQAGDTTSPPTPGVGHDYIHAPVETVNPANGSVSIRIPVRISSGRELTIPLDIAYDSSGAFYYGMGPGITEPSYATTTGVPFSQGGWSYTFPLLTFSQTSWVVNNGSKNLTCTGRVNYVFQDPSGNRHDMDLAANTSISSYSDWCGSDTAQTGGEGPILAVTGGGGEPTATITDGNGTVYSFAGGLGANLPTSVTDRNGNTISVTSGTSSASLEDTAGRTAVSVSTFGGSPDDIDVAGLSSPYAVSWTTASASFTITVDNLNPGISNNCPTSLSNSAKAVSQIVLPNGQKYSFSYDPTYGMLDKITYPTGGYVSYTWGINSQAEAGIWTGQATGQTVSWDCRYDFPAITDRYVSFNGTTEALHQHFTYSTSWPSGSGDYTSKTTTVTTYDLIRNTSFETIYTYTAFSSPCQPNLDTGTCANGTFTQQLPYEETIQYYGTNGSLLKTVTKGWYNPGAYGTARPTLSSVQTTLAGSNPSLTVYCYNASQEVTEKNEYDLGSTAITPPSCSNGVPSGTTAGPLLRETLTSYDTFTGAHIVDLPSSVITYNGSGTRVAETDSSYDQTGLQTLSPVQLTTAPGGSARGNLTTVTKQCFQGSTNCSQGNSTTTYSYYNTGQIYQMTDPNSNVTTFSYTDSYSSCGGNAPSGTTNAYLTQVTYPQTSGVNHIESYCYDYSAGLLRGSTDENSQTTTYAYADSLDRLTEINYPDTGETIASYNDTPPTPSVTVEKKLNTSGQYVTSVSITDGVGQPIESELTSDPAGTDLALTSYDGVGRKYTVTNPYRSTSDPTYGVTTYSYDSLNRTTQVSDPDGSTVGTVYSGNCTTVTDEAGKNRESCTDGLGRVTSVIENPGGLGYTTSYTYDPLDDLVSILQNGSRQRNFSYDSLSHLTQSVNPESGTITYSYDANGNVLSRVAPLENQTGSSTVTTAYAYDALNRLTSKSYSDGTAGAIYYYDQNDPFGVSIANPIGRRVAEWVGTGSWQDWNAFSYDPMGRIVELVECVPVVPSDECGQAFTTNQTYDLAGDMTSYTNGQNVTFTQTFNTAAQLTEVTSSYIDSQHPGTLAVFNSYSPFDEATSTSYGNGLTEATAFNDRLQICRANMNSSGTALSTCTSAIPSGNLLDLNNGWNAGTSDNGDVAGVIATGNETFNRTFTYDALNRIASMSDSDTVASCQGLTWGYDAWANRTAQTVTKGTCGQWSSSYAANNQISGYSYDAAGNLLNDGVHSYTYDAENRIIAVDGGSTATYLYDPEGRRKLKTIGTTTTSFIYDLDGRVIADYQTPPGGWWAGYVYANGQFIAEYADSTTYFIQTDHLGSTRLVTAMNQSVLDSLDYLPFGEQIQGDTYTSHKFTGKMRDSESNLDEFGARYYSSQLGRFMSVDWSALPEAVPYANLTNPQTLNLYAIVADNPETFADLDGHGPPEQDCWVDVCGAAIDAGGLEGDGPSEQSNGDGQPLSDSQQAEALAQQLADQTNPEAPGKDLASPCICDNPQQNAGTPAPTNPDGTPAKPPVPPPGCSDCGWKWSPDSQNPRGGRWDPTGWKGPNPPSGSWDPENGHWDIDNGTGERTRYLPDGTEVDHDNRPIPTTNMWDKIKAIPPRPVAAAGTAAIIIYIVVSEGTRVFPWRNLVPVP